jgi:hypothetical protein
MRPAQPNEPESKALAIKAMLQGQRVLVVEAQADEGGGGHLGGDTVDGAVVIAPRSML